MWRFPRKQMYAETQTVLQGTLPPYTHLPPNHDSPTSTAYSWLRLPWSGPRAVDRVLKGTLLQESPVRPDPDPQPSPLHRAWAAHPRGAHTFHNNSPSTPSGTHLFQLLNLSSGLKTGTKGLSLWL